MSVIGELLLLPLTAPVRGFRFLMERIHDEALAALLDEGRTYAELVEVSMRRNSGQLSEAEFAAQEAELLARLSAIREYRDEQALAELEVDDDDQQFDAEAGWEALAEGEGEEDAAEESW